MPSRPKSCLDDSVSVGPGPARSDARPVRLCGVQLRGRACLPYAWVQVSVTAKMITGSRFDVVLAVLIVLVLMMSA